MSTVAVRSAALPPPIPGLNRRIRQPKKNIPQTKPERDQILGWVRAYAEEQKLVPPVPLVALPDHPPSMVIVTPSYNQAAFLERAGDRWMLFFSTGWRGPFPRPRSR